MGEYMHERWMHAWMVADIRVECMHVHGWWIDGFAVNGLILNGERWMHAFWIDGCMHALRMMYA